MQALYNIQQITSIFVWRGKKPRIRMATLNKNAKEGGIAMPNGKVNYYYAANLANISQWWYPVYRGRGGGEQNN